ncbi:MAG: tetratricopeptide repeat protein [Anaerolineae bacterium]|nr:tetratricopeptide repeat protein [Anaerolineae bacterium]
MMGYKLQKKLLKLQKDLNILQTREAKFGAGQAPLELLHLIEDHESAIKLTEQALAGQISEKELDEELKSLNLAFGGSVQNIIQMVPIPFVMGGLAIGVVVAISLFLNTSWGQIAFGPMPTATPLFTTPAEAHELLILVAEFESAGNKIVKAHEDIYDKLQEEIKRLDLANVRVQLAPKVSQDQQIETWQQVYKPIFIIWGGTDDVRTLTKFSITAPTSDDFASIPTTKTLLDLQDFNLFITYELPEQMAFFAKFTLGQIYFRNDQLQEADKVFASALQNYSPKIPAETLATAYFYQGFTSQKLNQLDEAVDQYQQAIERNPALYQAHYNRGVALTEQGLLNEAIKEFTQAIELNQDLPFAYFNRANILRIGGQLDKALQDYNQGLKLSPENPDALLARGAVYREQGEYELALADYNRTIELAPNFAMAYIFRAELYEEQDAKAEAEANYDKASSLLDPQQENDLYIYAQGSRAWLAYERGDYQTAIQANQALLKSSQTVTSEQPSFLELQRIRYNLTLALLADGQTSQAKAEYDIALNLAPASEMLDQFITDLETLHQVQPANASIAEFLSYIQAQPINQ